MDWLTPLKELLAKQLASAFVKYGEGDALVADKINFKGKSRDMLHSRSSGDSSFPGKKEEFSNYYVNHVAKQNIDVISMKQETIKDIHSGDMVASIEEIKEINSEQAVSGAIYADGDLYGEIEEDVWEVEVSDQSLAILRSVIGLDQVLEADGDDEYQIDKEADLKGQILGGTTDDITFESSKVAKHVIEELERESGDGSSYGVEAS
ncbi:hypothetical protein KY284_021147 [Solanum tuberosum]|nr:hypothetical protein KY284_021147 [Solanum tuberosum]